MSLCAVCIATVGRRVLEAGRRFEAARLLVANGCQLKFESNHSLMTGALRKMFGQKKFSWDRLVSVVNTTGHFSDDDAKRLAIFVELRDLQLNRAAIGEFTCRAISRLVNLEELNLANSQFDSIDFCRDMRKLTSLDLSHTQVDNLQVLLQHPQLLRLNLSSTQIGEPELKVISQLPHLSSLEIAYARLGDQDLRHLEGTRLTELSLLGVPVTDDGMQWLAGMNELAVLDLSYASITGVGLSRLNARSTLKRLMLEDTDVENEDLKVVSEFIELEELCLEGLRIDDAGLAWLQGLKKLTRLDLEGTQVVGPGLKYLSDLPSLEQLNLYNLPVTDMDLAQLQKLPKACVIELWNSRASQAMIQSLQIPGQNSNLPR